MAGGYRSLLGFWAGGASGGVAPVVTGGKRSLLATWIGGASAPAAAPTQAGFRSLFGFWGGGIFAPEFTPAPEVPIPQELISGGYSRKETIRQINEARDDHEIQEISIILAVLFRERWL